MIPSRFTSGNYLKAMARSFYRNRAYSLLNLFGLSVGFAVFIFSMMYVYFETHFENFHSNADRIFRATYRYAPSADYQAHWARVPVDYINQLPGDVAGIKQLIRFQNHARKYVRVGKEKFRPEHAYATDKEVFRVFSFELVAGAPESALAEPYAVVISQSLATRYFGDMDPLGKEIFVISDLDKTETLHQVTGVMKDLPANTHLPVDMLISFRDESERAGWAYTYVMLEEGANIDDVRSNIPGFIRKHTSEEEAKINQIIFQPLSEIHLQSNLAREIVPNGNAFYIKVIGFAGMLILVMAVINFMNLHSAMALGRGKEIGMRKILGAGRAQLVLYLLSESILYHVMAMVVAAGMAYATYPYIHSMVSIEFLPELELFAGSLLLLAIVCGSVAGVYPVMLLTGLKPMSVLKTTKGLAFSGKENAFSLKRVMVTLQLAISVLLIGTALLVNSQFRFLLNKNLGIESEQIVALPGVPDAVKERFETFRTRVSGQPGIVDVTACMEVPSREIRDAGPVLVEGVNDDPAKAPVMDIQVIDHRFAPLMGIKILAGRNVQPLTNPVTSPTFSETYTIQQYLREQPREYLINETAMRQLGWNEPSGAVGQKISWSIGDLALAPGKIAGVVQDFHQESLKNKVDPVVMVQEPIWLRTFLVKVNTGNIAGSLEKVDEAWNELFPSYPMEYHFLDDLYENLYKGERTQVQLLFAFSALAILVAFIGLVGLVAYALKTRTREIAVRKVLGATIKDLIRMMAREYIIVLLIGSVLAIPVSVFAVREWLSGFAYRIDISPVAYVATVSIVLAVLVVTVGMQTLRAARANPANTLRDE